MIDIAPRAFIPTATAHAWGAEQAGQLGIRRAGLASTLDTGFHPRMIVARDRTPRSAP
jgi:hypothetical protein